MPQNECFIVRRSPKQVVVGRRIEVVSGLNERNMKDVTSKLAVTPTPKPGDRLSRALHLPSRAYLVLRRVKVCFSISYHIISYHTVYDRLRVGTSPSSGWINWGRFFLPLWKTRLQFSFRQSRGYGSQVLKVITRMISSAYMGYLSTPVGCDWLA